MTTDFEVEGPNLHFRLITPDDAEFVYGLRIDDALSRHLSPVTGDVEDQRQWIRDYKARESAGTEYYFVIERRDRVRCGLVRVYGIEGDLFTWGSWILNAQKPSKAALESALLVYKFGFEILDLTRAVFEVSRENTHTIAFHRRFGAKQIGESDTELFFEYTRVSYEANKDAQEAALKNLT